MVALPMLDLYHYSNSVCSQKARMTLFEKGLEWRGFEVNLFTSEQYDPEYLKLNPKGYVPALIDGGTAIRESTLICEYLDENYPSPPLMPDGAAGRAQVRLWSKAVDEGLFEGATVFSFSAMFRDRMQAMSDEERERRYRNVGDPVRRDRHKSVFEHGVDSPYVARAVAAYEIAFRAMEEALAGGRAWLVGDMFSLAEVNLAPFVARLEYLSLLDVWTGERPNFGAWWQNVKDRPSYQAEVAGPLSGEEVDEMRVSGARIKNRVKELRAEYLAWA
jgi:glutathione S-transferase